MGVVTDEMVEIVGSSLYVYWNDVDDTAKKAYRKKVRSALDEALQGVEESTHLDPSPDGVSVRHQYRRKGGQWTQVTKTDYENCKGDWTYELRTINVITGDTK